MLLAETNILSKRNFRLSQRETLFDPTIWFVGKPFSTQLLNAYTLLIPKGERFIIRTCSAYLDHVKPELKDELKTLFFQEGGHSREHTRVVKTMRTEGLSLDVFQRLVDWLSYRIFEPLCSRKVRLATAAAIEHHNAVIASFFLKQGLLQDVQVAELRRMFLWHFAEEIEHKETVFKLLQYVSPSWSMRALGLAVSLGTFIFYLSLGTLLLSVKTLSVFSAAFWREFLTLGLSSKGLPFAIVRNSVLYLKPGFHPCAEESRALLDSALTELDRLGIERPTQESVPARPLPIAFHQKMAPQLERIRGLELKHQFFFSRIDGYEGPWVMSQGKRKLNFCTYSYLGLLHHPYIQEAAQKALEQYGTGTHGVRLLGGNLSIHEQLETEIARFFHREDAISFSSGYMTNLAVIGTLLQKGDHVISDEFNHASIIDGCRFSGAVIERFRHNDMTELHDKLCQSPRDARKLIVADAVYSMDGDIAPLRELIELRNRHPNTLLMIDEAHSLGVLGTHGTGIEEHFDCRGQVDVLMGTLSKTLPAQGGFIAGSNELIKFLRYNARGFIFSAALSPATTAAAMAGFEIIDKEGRERRERLMSNVCYFIGRLREEGFDVGSGETAIVPILLKSEKVALEMANRCNLQGIYAMPVGYPAVPAGTERLRMNVTYDHQKSDLDYAIQALVRARAAS